MGKDAKKKYLADYKAPRFAAPKVELGFELYEDRALVTNKTQYKRLGAEDTLCLNGEGLSLKSLKINGEELSQERYRYEEEQLWIDKVPEQFELESVVEIKPQENTALEGLYKSGAIFCTQNEPEGFRRITFHLDRPDVMSKYTTRIEADSKAYPVLLSNGNPIDQGSLEGGRHFATWEDPFPKPSYLYALVAGDLGLIRDEFTTCSGRKIDLRLYCDKGQEDKCWHAMASLKKSMKWDEEVFGLEYDLDIFMIVAVDSFNMGAMENKGLNIFNSSCILADPQTATDKDYAWIEGVVAHEYFHNWTGNRVTCRDWFQLTLKEGLTVFRDQEFSSDMNSRSVKRIEDVQVLRARQFAEDAGPLSHPIKPQEYLEINNFYTTTIYNKGAEIIRMIQTLLGKETFLKGIAKYFELYDGQAVTTEDFIHAMEQASNQSLGAFKRWYSTPGTPHVHVSSHWEDKKLSLTLTQSIKHPEEALSQGPLTIPLRVAFLSKQGEVLDEQLLVLDDYEKSFSFDHLESEPLLSINRGFSAPVIIDSEEGDATLGFIMKHDSDGFNIWDASQELGFRVAQRLIEGEHSASDPHYLQYLGKLIEKPFDPALKAMVLVPPVASLICDRQKELDPQQVFAIREQMSLEIAKPFEGLWQALYKNLNSSEPYAFDPTQVGKRSLKNVALSYWVKSGSELALEKAFAQSLSKHNMTDRLAALSILSQEETPLRQEALDRFYEDFKSEPLVINKWLSVQAASKREDTLEQVKRLKEHPSFDIKMPNNVRALMGSFTANLRHFHSQEGYRFIADAIIELNALNPLVAAGLARSFKDFAKLKTLYKETMATELERILATPKLSKNVYEIISKTFNREACKSKA